MSTTTAPLFTLEMLQSFCSVDETRPHLFKPFSDDKWTYATDARIVIRIPRIEPPTLIRSMDGSLRTAIDRLQTVIFAVDESDGIFHPLPTEPKEGWGYGCKTCLGKGRTKSVRCDYCWNEIQLLQETVCLECDGLGRRMWNFGVRFGNQILNASLLRKLSSLTDVRIACHKSDPMNGALTLLFPGGDGRIMPMSNAENLQEHETQTPAVA